MLQSDILKVKLADSETDLARLKAMGQSENVIMKVKKAEADIDDYKTRIKKAETEEAAERDKLKAGAGPAPVDQESVELNDLENRVSISKLYNDHVAGRKSQGAESEYLAATDSPERTIPYRLLKADTVTGNPTVTGQNIAEVIPATFVRAAETMVQPKLVDSGTYHEIAVTTNLTAEMHAQGAATESSALGTTVKSTEPHLVTGRESRGIVDKAKVGIPSYDAAVRRNLMMVTADKMTEQVLKGDGSGANINGLLNQLTAATDPTAVVTFQSFGAAVASAIDGKWAGTLKDVKSLTNPEVMRLLSILYQTPVFIDKGAGVPDASGVGSRSVLSAADWGMSNTGGLACNAHMPDGASNISKALLVRAGSMIDPQDQASMPACLPIWGSIEIADVFTDSAKGIEHVTLHYLFGDVIIRQPDVYREVRFKTA